ncbi:zinc ABC transporter substrate-binding protein [Candidatus Endowatersipora endosymbiont of Watersipora subatra]|uniref:zinc ABC transporter substrate-binding protein n=1 Tax=Candidatus Endowatersipora endosymbiont of Watersipora subatra TaxID=3077946 RepID=UPI00312C8CAA
MLPFLSNVASLIWFILFWGTISGLANFASAGAEAEPRVVVSLKPLHSLVANIMDDIAVPDLLITRSRSPHESALKPSQAQKLQKADMVIWIGPELESFLASPVQSISRTAVNFQIGRLFTSNLHHDVPKIDTISSYAKNRDSHVWLSPQKAKIIASKIAEKLSKIDPQNGDLYRKNAKKIIVKITLLERDLTKKMSKFKDHNFLVFHDAYSHFTRYFGLTDPIVATIHPMVRPGASKIRSLQKAIQEKKIRCAFTEPQVEYHLLDTIIDSLPVHITELDPIGTKVPPGPEAYFQILNNLAVSFSHCLDRNSLN